MLLTIVRNEYVELLAGCARRVQPGSSLVVLPVLDPLADSSQLRQLPVVSGNPVRAVLEAVAEQHASLVAVACEAHRSRWTWFRPLVEDVLRSAPCPVLVCKPTPAQVGRLQEPIRRILVPLDGSRPADGVLPYVTGLAKAHGAEVVLLSVEELHCQPDWREAEEFIEHLAEAVDVSPEDLAELNYPTRALERLGERHERLAAEGVEVRSEVALGDVVDAINGFAEQADLLVMSKSGLRVDGDQHWFGSVAKHVLRSTLVPLIVCPAGESARLPRQDPRGD